MTIPDPVQTDGDASVGGVHLDGLPHERGTPTGPPSNKSSARWAKAGSKVKLGVMVSGGFKTLRDMSQVNEVSMSQLTIIKKLGEGAFAVVEEAEYQAEPGGDKRRVAVKRLKPATVDHLEDLDAFFKEAGLMRKLKHRYIVDYIGIGSSDTSSDAAREKSMFLVQEFMGGGTLKRLVSTQMGRPHSTLYSHADALRWMTQIAEALAYLHSASPTVIHRDLKLENILLTAGPVRRDQEAKLADFGLVTFVKNQKALRPEVPMRKDSTVNDEQKAALTEQWTSRLQRMASKRANVQDDSVRNSAFRTKQLAAVTQLSGKTGTLMYMAPEMFSGFEYDEKVDTFSFAIIMNEVFSKYIMLCAISINGTEEEIEAYAERVSEGFRPPLNPSIPDVVNQLIADCWAQEPAKRPSMSEVAQRLRDIQASGIVAETAASGCSCTIC